MIRTLTAALATTTCLVALASPAAAQTREFNIPPGSLRTTLDAFARQSGRQVIYRGDEVRSTQSKGVRGAHTAEEALNAILAGTGFKARTDSSGAVAIVRFGSLGGADPSSTAIESESTDIVVTGSRIRGAAPISPVSTTTREEALQSGQNDLGQIIRDLPQNYSGGQNPTIAGGGQAGYTNTAGSSAINLRGLGADATLTLFNGHRIAFDAISQGVDISAVPLAAIERVDVLTDGASALYGSDAVGGVANVILRRDFQGLETSARIGSTTDGGAFTQQYDAVTGRRWRTGGFMIAADFTKSDAISAGDRVYTDNIYPTYTLIPGQRQVSVVAAGHQSLSDTVTFELDGNYLHRTSYRCLPTSATADCTTEGDTVATKIESFSVTPSLRVELPGRWTAKLSGTYSKSNTYVTSSVFDAGAKLAYVLPKYFDTLKNIEAGAEGPLFTLPGGDVRAAIGAGYRTNGLNVNSQLFAGGSEQVIDLFKQSQDVLFGYGEVFVPLVSPGNHLPGIEKLELTGAFRYENYRHITSITTPKFGLLYAPVPFIELKASWGKSFKAPTLYQTGQTSNAQLVDASNFIPSPASMLPVLYLFGGNRNLTPERATTWTFSGKIEPPFLKGFSVEASYFKIDYHDRVAEPLLSSTNAFSAIYADYVKLNPSAAEVEATVNSVTGSFENLTSGAFDPSAVSAIVYDQLQNVSALNVRGVDITARYSVRLNAESKLTVKGAATYITSNRQITQSLPSQQVAGTVFNLPHWRGRASASWSNDQVTITAVGNYIGSTVDNRTTPIFPVSAFADMDAVIEMRSKASQGLLKNMRWTLAIENVFNQRPAAVRNTDPLGLRYDSINDPTYGRTISLTINKAW